MLKYFTVGPSQLYPTVKKHITTALENDVPSFSHRSPWFGDLYAETRQNLGRLFNLPENYYVFFLGSATEAMERMIQSCVKNQSFHFVSGAFGRRFEKISQDYGKLTGHQQVQIDQNEWFDFQVEKPKKAKFSYLQAILASSVYQNSQPIYFQDCDLACFTQNETSTGVQINLQEVYKLKQKFPQVLNSIDGVSSFPLVEIDFSFVDSVFFSVQKIFGLPSGLGVLIVSPKCIEKSGKIKADPYSDSVGSYFSLPQLAKQAELWQTPHTPNILGIYLLNEICKDFLTKGLKNIQQEIKEKADLLYNYFDNHSNFKPFVTNEKIRSRTTLVIKTNLKSSEVLSELESKGFIVSPGYGQSKEKVIRIANFPATSVEEVENLLTAFKEIKF